MFEIVQHYNGTQIGGQNYTTFPKARQAMLDLIEALLAREQKWSAAGGPLHTTVVVSEDGSNFRKYELRRLIG